MVNFSMAGKRGGKTGYPSLCICRSAFLIIPFVGRLSGASIAMRVGFWVVEFLMISLLLWRWQANIVLFFQRAQPVGFLGVPAKSIPVMTFSLISDIACQL